MRELEEDTLTTTFTATLVRRRSKNGETILAPDSDEDFQGDTEQDEDITSYEPELLAAQRTRRSRPPIENIDPDDDMMEVTPVQPKTFDDPFQKCYQALTCERANVSRWTSALLVVVLVST